MVGTKGPATSEDVHLWVRVSLSKLDPVLREILHMKILEGRSYHEIARASGLTVTEVGRLTHRALKDLSKSFRCLPGLDSLPDAKSRGAPGELSES